MNRSGLGWPNELYARLRDWRNAPACKAPSPSRLTRPVRASRLSALRSDMPGGGSSPERPRRPPEVRASRPQTTSAARRRCHLDKTLPLPQDARAVRPHGAPPAAFGGRLTMIPRPGVGLRLPRRHIPCRGKYRNPALVDPRIGRRLAHQGAVHWRETSGPRSRRLFGESLRRQKS
jgi:hypothetical protein